MIGGVHHTFLIMHLYWKSRVQMTNALGTNFCKLRDTCLEAFNRHSSLSCYMYTVIPAIAVLQVGVQMINALQTNFCQPGRSEMPCLETFIVRTGRSVLIMHSISTVIPAIAILESAHVGVQTNANFYKPWSSDIPTVHCINIHYAFHYYIYTVVVVISILGRNANDKCTWNKF